MTGIAIRGADAAPLSIAGTVGATFLILAATMAGRVAAMLGAGIALGRIDPNAIGEAADRADGFLFCLGILGGTATGGAVMWALLRRRSPSRYLALERPRARTVALGVLASLGLVILFDGARWLTTGSLVPAGWLETFRSAESVPLLVVALVIVAPCFEEALFRGLLYRGLASTRVGPAGAIAITSVLFMLVHSPEDIVSALDPLASGIVLGIIRQRTGSIATGVAMHAFGNLQAIVMVAALSAS